MEMLSRGGWGVRGASGGTDAVERRVDGRVVEKLLHQLALGSQQLDLAVASGRSASWERAEASCGGHGEPPRCPGGALGCVGAAWALGATRRADGAVWSSRVGGHFQPAARPPRPPASRRPSHARCARCPRQTGGGGSQRMGCDGGGGGQRFGKARGGVVISEPAWLVLRAPPLDLGVESGESSTLGRPEAGS